jgi:hypothetical protein
MHVIPFKTPLKDPQTSSISVKSIKTGTGRGFVRSGAKGDLVVAMVRLRCVLSVDPFRSADLEYAPLHSPDGRRDHLT